MAKNACKTVKPKTFFSLLSVFLLFTLNTAFAQIHYPEISNLSAKDSLFEQYIQDVDQNYLNTAKNEPPHVSIYSYKAKKQDTLHTIASRCNIPYETIATINRIPSIDAVLEGKILFLPTAPGLYITNNPKNTLEHFLYQKNFDINTNVWYTIQGEKFFFVSRKRLSSTERTFFLDSSLISPLPEGVLTSSYGTRISPISGCVHFHPGVDLAAPTGTPVRACKSGKVEKTGTDSTYGKYVIILHDNGMRSLYAHLSFIEAKQGESVNRGQYIGKVGTTGLSTGPHLHFEIRVGNKTQDPGSFFSTKTN